MQAPDQTLIRPCRTGVIKSETNSVWPAIVRHFCHHHQHHHHELELLIYQQDVDAASHSSSHVLWHYSQLVSVIIHSCDVGPGFINGWFLIKPNRERFVFQGQVKRSLKWWWRVGGVLRFQEIRNFVLGQALLMCGSQGCLLISTLHPAKLHLFKHHNVTLLSLYFFCSISQKTIP